MNQIALPLDWPVADRDEDFLISEANRAAFEHLKRWSLWPVMATLLTGPRKSGRSLLGRIFVRKTGGRLFDNAEEHDEEALFHAWNEAQATRRPLLIVADAPPPRWEVALPDLRSRLAATPHVAIGEPDDALIGAADRQAARRPRHRRAARAGRLSGAADRTQLCRRSAGRRRARPRRCCRITSA